MEGMYFCFSKNFTYYEYVPRFALAGLENINISKVTVPFTSNDLNIRVTNPCRDPIQSMGFNQKAKKRQLISLS